MEKDAAGLNLASEKKKDANSSKDSNRPALRVVRPVTLPMPFTSLHGHFFPLMLVYSARSCCSLLTDCALCSLCRCRPETDREPNLQGAPTELIHLMKRCWALGPLDRPRTFQEIASALDSIEKRAGASSADQGGYCAAGLDNSTEANFNVANPIFSSHEQAQLGNELQL